jgi:hypothetical protein
MSNEALWKTSDAAMLDSLSLQLREAENRRAEAERAHQVSFHFLFLSLIHYTIESHCV